MDDFGKAEFWKGLGNLYDATVQLRISVEKLAEIAERHERRLDRAEVTLEAILEDLRKRREKRNGEQ